LATAIGADPEPASATELRVTINEIVDASVFDRWRADSSYWPPSLVDWASARRIDPAGLKTCVCADGALVAV